MDASFDPTNCATTPTGSTDGMEIMQETGDDHTTGAYVGQCKWFNNSYGYGFLTVWEGPEKGKDIFVHHSGVEPMNSMYKTLKKGEYVTFDISGGDKGQQATNVRGICGGPLLCDHVQVKKTGLTEVIPPGYAQQYPPNTHNANNAKPQQTTWNTVSYRKTRVPIGAKRQRFGGPVPADVGGAQSMSPQVE
jgi:cold shock protein